MSSVPKLSYRTQNFWVLPKETEEKEQISTSGRPNSPIAETQMFFRARDWFSRNPDQSKKRIPSGFVMYEARSLIYIDTLPQSSRRKNSPKGMARQLRHWHTQANPALEDEKLRSKWGTRRKREAMVVENTSRAGVLENNLTECEMKTPIDSSLLL